MGDKLAGAIESSVPLLQFRIEKELEKFELDEPEARGRAVRAAGQLIGAHPDPVTRHEYAVFVSRHTGVDLDVVLQSMGHPKRETGTRSQAPAPPEEKSLTGRQKGERDYLRLLLGNDRRLDRTIPPEAFSDALHRRGYGLLLESLSELAEGETPDLGSLLPDDDVGNFLRRLALAPGPPPADPIAVGKRLRRDALDDQLAVLRIGLDELDPESEPYRERLRQILDLESAKRALRSD